MSSSREVSNVKLKIKKGNSKIVQKAPDSIAGAVVVPDENNFLEWEDPEAAYAAAEAVDAELAKNNTEKESNSKGGTGKTLTTFTVNTITYLDKKSQGKNFVIPISLRGAKGDIHVHSLKDIDTTVLKWLRLNVFNNENAKLKIKNTSTEYLEDSKKYNYSIYQPYYKKQTARDIEVTAKYISNFSGDQKVTLALTNWSKSI